MITKANLAKELHMLSLDTSGSAESAGGNNAKDLSAQAEACSAALPELQATFKTACAAEQHAADPDGCGAAKSTIKTQFKKCKALLKEVNALKKAEEDTAGGANSGAGGADVGTGALKAHKGRLGGIVDMKWGEPVSLHTTCMDRQVRMGGEARNQDEKTAMSVQCALEQGKFWSDPIQMNIANHCPTQSVLFGKGATHLSAFPELMPKSEFQLKPGEGGRYEGYERELWVAVDRNTGEDLDQWVLDVGNGVVQDFVITCAPKTDEEKAKFI